MNYQDRKDRMRELTAKLNEASKAYYAEDREIISNFEYDALYDELRKMEEETGIVLAGSPTLRVGYEAVEELPKERHERPMLSLDKTKDREALAEWLDGREGLLSWKLDGLTIVLTYREGKLLKAVTRGNGEIGEVITGNAKVFQNIPLRISYTGELILRGEAVITYSDFERVNEEIEDVSARYKNPRNLCSGSVRQLDNRIAAGRNIRFYAFGLVKAENVDFENSREKEFAFLSEQGFEVVEYHKVTPESVAEKVDEFEKKVAHYDIPSDGLVLTYEDIAYGESLGQTSKFPRNSIAFKWQDEIRETELLEIEWSPSRTGLINPVAIFKPVELEGTTVSRASVHNISILRALKLGLGDKITVYKANMIIPQIAENLTGSDTLKVPERCPVCGGETEIRQVADAASLYCTNADCAAKKIKAFAHLVSRDALNIDGLSEATLEKFIGKGFIHEFADIFHLERYKEKIVEMEGFGEKSYRNLIAKEPAADGKLSSIEAARRTTLPRFLYALGISGIGLANAKMICGEFGDDFEKMLQADEERLGEIDGVGGVLAGAFVSWFRDAENLRRARALFEELSIEKREFTEGGSLSGKSFVITGSLTRYENRDAMKEAIEAKGGKVTGSVTKKTACLINNDIASNSSKNKKAKELGIPIVTEADFIAQYLEQ
ncbi:MAG: NAD-dependent DNA ligase LigA [Lachnospiraceae bacterium]|jgi:DNA ligase (NAD+)|nr:NAD-dependent DNA ligase LigA [Lachnospiraceae bacterium]